jgi:hypothetical protein
MSLVGFHKYFCIDQGSSLARELKVQTTIKLDEANHGRATQGV